MAINVSNLRTDQGNQTLIDSTVRLGKGVELGDRVVIEPYAVIHENVTLGEECHVGSHAVIGATPTGYLEESRQVSTNGCTIGPKARIGPSAVIESDVTIGEGLRLAGHSTIRQGSRIGTHFRVGSYTDVRGDCRVGDHVTCHSHVHVSCGSRIGSFCWLMPYVVLLNDRYPPTMLEEEGVTIGDYSVIGCHSILFPGVVLGRHVIVGAGCHVKCDVGDYQLVIGNQSRIVGDSRSIPCKLGKDYCRPYPWTEHVSQGFPWEGTDPRT